MLQVEIIDPHGSAKNKKAACDPVGDSHAADKGYVAETRP